MRSYKNNIIGKVSYYDTNTLTLAREQHGFTRGCCAGTHGWKADLVREVSELHYPIEGLLCSKTRISANNFSPGKHYLNPGLFFFFFCRICKYSQSLIGEQRGKAHVSRSIQVLLCANNERKQSFHIT